MAHSSKRAGATRCDTRSNAANRLAERPTCPPRTSPMLRAVAPSRRCGPRSASPRRRETMIREWHVSDSDLTDFVADKGPELSRDTQTTTQTAAEPPQLQSPASSLEASMDRKSTRPELQ